MCWRTRGRNNWECWRHSEACRSEFYISFCAWNWYCYWIATTCSVRYVTIWASWWRRNLWLWICGIWDTSTLSISFPPGYAWYFYCFWEAITFSITVLTSWADYWRNKLWCDFFAFSVPITFISSCTYYWDRWSNTVSESIWIKTCWTQRNSWDWSRSERENLVSFWNRWVVWWVCWCLNPNTISFLVCGKTLGAWYLSIYIWKTVSFSIWVIFTWTSWCCFNNCRNAISWSIVSKSWITNNRNNCEYTISVSVTFVSTWTKWVRDRSRSYSYTISICIKIVALSTC